MKTRGLTTNQKIAVIVCVVSVEFYFTVNFPVVAVDQQDPNVTQ